MKEPRPDIDFNQNLNDNNQEKLELMIKTKIEADPLHNLLMQHEKQWREIAAKLGGLCLGGVDIGDNAEKCCVAIDKLRADLAAAKKMYKQEKERGDNWHRAKEEAWSKHETQHGVTSSYTSFCAGWDAALASVNNQKADVEKRDWTADEIMAREG